MSDNVESVPDTGFDNFLSVGGKVIRPHPPKFNPDEDPRITQARMIANSAHAGQVDKSGQPYIDHPRRVAARLSDPTEVVVAWLHDVLEDSDTPEGLLRATFGDEVTDAVVALTHNYGHHESRVDYYTRVRANPTALAVKKADIADNTDPHRLALLKPDLRARLETKYALATQILDWEPSES